MDIEQQVALARKKVEELNLIVAELAREGVVTAFETREMHKLGSVKHHILEPYFSKVL